MRESDNNIREQLEKDIKILDEFSHPMLTEEFVAHVTRRMTYMSFIYRWSVIAAKTAVAACIVLGLFWFAFAELNISSSVTKYITKNNKAVAYNVSQPDIDEQIDMLYDEFNNTVKLSADKMSDGHDILDNLNEDLNELTREINNG